MAMEGEEGRDEFWQYLRAMTLRPMREVKYFILSHGPNLDHDGPEDRGINRAVEQRFVEVALVQSPGLLSIGRPAACLHFAAPGKIALASQHWPSCAC